MAQPKVLLQIAALGTAAAAAHKNGLDWLTEGERARLAKMRAGARRAEFVAGHWLARRLAAHWLRVPPRRVTLDAFADGRPALHLDAAPVPLSLSIAHSSDWLALALGEVAVGVDVELPKRGRDLAALTRMAFSAAQARELRALEEPEREAGFYARWALKEAWVKRSGEGLRPRQARTIQPEPCDEGGAEARSWAFHGGALALALGVPVRLEIHGARLHDGRYWRYAR
ncbi:4'-phosphopantetheinyl transferase superfamily protein [Thermomonas sp.]|uniref:4'-phosphopantetheinyl transferase family protein n=1 Tax=Thermomonas sp. TaxID=1971895 RepID=UPI002CDCD611|nr:4'-phosphopantetheinyl transferase superfamily protein [Thermomonas sp.]HRO63790.1 4'-phosphopantetheinyl transferase superfamily protein [Thermomonas sp.]